MFTSSKAWITDRVLVVLGADGECVVGVPRVGVGLVRVRELHGCGDGCPQQLRGNTVDRPQERLKRCVFGGLKFNRKRDRGAGFSLDNVPHTNPPH